MTTISPKEFGQMVSDVKNISDDIKDVKLEMKGIHTRIDNHMDKEEAEREEMTKMAREDKKEILSTMEENAKASQARHDAAQKATLERFAILEAGYNQAKIEKNVRDQYNKIFFVVAGTAVSTIGAIVFFLLRVGVLYFFPDSVVAKTISQLYSFSGVI